MKVQLAGAGRSCRRDPEQLAVRDVGEIEEQEGGNEHGPGDLKDELFPGEEPVAAPLAGGGGQFEPVVHAAEDAEPQEHEDRLLDEGIVELGPQQRGRDGGAENDQAAHRRRIGLFLRQLVEPGMVELRPVPDLLPHQPANDPRADQQRNSQAGQDRQNRTEQDVLVRIEVQRIGEEIPEIPKQMIDHVPLMNDY
jgi:hypothetical protein